MALPGCAPYIGSCSWAVPESGALETVAERQPTSGECDCINCDAPGRFVLEREKYSLEFWNGDRWYAELYVRSHGENGEVLLISSDSPALVQMDMSLPSNATHGFEHFVRLQSESGEPLRSLRITISDAAGQLLGVETIQLRVESRKDFAIETI